MKNYCDDFLGQKKKKIQTKSYNIAGKYFSKYNKLFHDAILKFHSGKKQKILSTQCPDFHDNHDIYEHLNEYIYM